MLVPLRLKSQSALFSLSQIYCIHLSLTSDLLILKGISCIVPGLHNYVAAIPIDVSPHSGRSEGVCNQSDFTQRVSSSWSWPSLRNLTRAGWAVLWQKMHRRSVRNGHENVSTELLNFHPVLSTQTAVGKDWDGLAVHKESILIQVQTADNCGPLQ